MANMTIIPQRFCFQFNAFHCESESSKGNNKIINPARSITSH